MNSLARCACHLKTDLPPEEAKSKSRFRTCGEDNQVATLNRLTYNLGGFQSKPKGQQMPYLKPERPEKVSAPSLKASKERGERLVCLTAYDYPTARIVDEAGIDVILVGDSLGN